MAWKLLALGLLLAATMMVVWRMQTAGRDETAPMPSPQLVGRPSIDRPSPAADDAPPTPQPTQQPTPPERSDDLPRFFWPPPYPSSQIMLPDEYFRRDAPMSLADLADLMLERLSRAKYLEYELYGVPHGFALVTRMERFDERGRRLKDPFRYLPPNQDEPFSVITYLQSLFFSAPGYYRVIVFIVSDLPFPACGAVANLPPLQHLPRGSNRLPRRYETQRYTKRHRVTVLVYEFQKDPRTASVSLAAPGRLAADRHLMRSSLALALSGKQ